MNDMKIFLLIGQSNMAGRGVIDDVPPLDHPNIHMWRDGQWMPAQEPLHTDKPKIAGIGLGMSFAHQVVTEMGISPVGLVACAVGGTPLSRWMPGNDLYEIAVKEVKAALNSGRLAGILWHQGEHDSCFDDMTETYGERLTQMVAHLREELDAIDVPFISGELGPYLKDFDGTVNFREVNTTLNSLGECIPNYTCVSADNLSDKGDTLHFNAVSLREFGQRYAKAYKSLMK